MGPAHLPAAGRPRPARAGRQTLAAAALCLLSLVCAAGAQQSAGVPPPGTPGVIKVPLAELDTVPGARESGHEEDHSGAHASAPDKAEPPLPPEAVTKHSLALPDRTLAFTAKVGAITFEDDKGAPAAEIGYFAFLVEGFDPRKRPVTFVINGGPGAASAWLNLAAIGPWRLSIAQPAVLPSGPADIQPNADTWLDFTDLVFIDPVGTGFTRLHAKDKAVREKFWSVKGDIESIVVAMKRWLEANGRVDSPRLIVGESYGGFRAPRLAQTLQAMPGLAPRGLVMISPALAVARLSFPSMGAALNRTASFPSLAAAIADGKGPVTAEQLKGFEHEAITGYLPDFLAGPRDAAAVERLAGRIAAITGLDIDAVRKLGPRASPGTFLEGIDRGAGLTSSMYDGTEKRIAAYDGPDQVDRGDDLGPLSLHLTRAMADVVERLGWKPARKYLVLARNVGWHWPGAESVTPLRSALVRDPTLRVLIAHGYADLVTPYFANKLILQQLPTIGPDNSRVRLEVYPGGHMFYSRDDSRARLRKDALALYEAVGVAR